MPAMQTKSGLFTPYALACGYVEKRWITGGSVTLGHGGSCYYVGYWHETSAPFRKYFRTLTAARAYFRRVGNHSTPEGK